MKAPRGEQLSCKNWQIEAAYRMLLNNLDPEVAEKPEELIVYGGTGKAARNHACLDKILECLKKLEPDETLLVASGKPVGITKTHVQAPRVLIANSNLVGKWANWETFHELEKKGLIMFGQMTAGSWIYIGTQGILQGTYETFAQCAKTHFKGSLSGKLVVSGGLGGMGGAQPLAAVIAGGVFLGVDVDEERIDKRLHSKYVDQKANSIDEALKICEKALLEKKALSVALVGNIDDVLKELLKRNIKIDVLTDQTSAHEPIKGYVPSGMTLDEAKDLRVRDSKKYLELSLKTMASHVNSMLEFKNRGSVVFDYGNNLRQGALEGGCENAFDIKGFVPLYIRPLFCEGQGPFRWVALSGDPHDIEVIDLALLKAFPENKRLTHWITAAKEKVAFQGLPARICWFGLGEREKAGLIINELVRTKQVKAPIVIGRDHLDCGSVASPNRETEAMKDGSDAIADWPILNALLSTASGASWVSFHHGGGVGIGYSLHAGLVIVADGTDLAAQKLKRVLTNDPMMGVFRHVDAGYEEAKNCAREKGVKVPFLN